MALFEVNEGRMAADWLKAEAASLYSRDQVTLAAGQGVLQSGTILGRVTATGAFVRHNAGAADGSQTAAGILLFTTDATNAVEAAIIARDALVAQQALIYGTGVTTAAARATVNGALRDMGIIVREGA